MTQEALERMVANGDYPYFPLREKSLDKVDLVSVKRVDPDDDSYDLVFVSKKGDQETQHVLRARIDQKITYIENPSQIFDL
ncbi:conserved domain protein [Peptoniphilus sp. oral taxon 375 str. F0436]|nr:conserved domain protein [Peptoniphilus sp. oral taxon 375 str. F0436]